MSGRRFDHARDAWVEEDGSVTPYELSAEAREARADAALDPAIARLRRELREPKAGA